MKGRDDGKKINSTLESVNQIIFWIFIGEFYVESHLNKPVNASKQNFKLMKSNYKL